MHSVMLLLALSLALGLAMVSGSLVQGLRMPEWRIAARFILLAIPPLLVAETSASILLMIGSDCFVHCEGLDQVVSVAAASAGVLFVGWRVAHFASRRSRIGRLVASLPPCRSRRAQAALRRLDPAGRVELRIVPKDAPMAFVYGHRRPIVVLSTWMLEQLDPRELEAALAHELAHVRRRDGLMIGLATLFSHCLPFSRHEANWVELLAETEELTDQHAAIRTRRPGALASALLKLASSPRVATTPHVLALAGRQQAASSQALLRRVERLVAAGDELRRAPSLRPGRALAYVLLVAGTIAVLIAAFCSAFMSTAHQVVC